MKIQRLLILIFCVLLFTNTGVLAQHEHLNQYNVVWNSQSKNSGESMPCGGGDVGLNVWVEKGEIYFYIAKSGTFDENNTLLKLGRIRIKLSPNPFEGSSFKQELILKDGYVSIVGEKDGLKANVNIWVDVFNSAVNVEVKSNGKVSTTASYENWRVEDRITKGKENNQNSYKWAPQGIVKTWKDSIKFTGNAVSFYHQNQSQTVVDVVLKQQQLEQLANGYNPIKNLRFGGVMLGAGMKATGTSVGKYLNTPFKAWNLTTVNASRLTRLYIELSPKDIAAIPSDKSCQLAFAKTKKWWNNYWERSFIEINLADKGKDSLAFQVGRNYQLFRYMLGCNAYGQWPTKFNGGLFTFDPVLTDTTLAFTPDFRNWGGGTHTAQNQRLVYWPMLKSGDFELMKPQFDFYLRLQKNAELRTKAAWGHKGASFTEQLENFGLPNPAEYAWKRPAGYDKGMEYNAWLEYEWDTVLEFCQMMLETNRYNNNDIKQYIPFIESCLTFFREHYLYLAKQRGAKSLDNEGHLVLYPGSGAETYKMAYNSTSTIAALKTVLSNLLEVKDLSSQQREEWTAMLKMIPSVSFRQFDGLTTISPAKTWERVNNTESPQLYPVFPWGMYGVGKPGLDTAVNTYLHDTDVLKFRSHVGWKQDNIFAARLGLTEEAKRLITLKLKDSGRRFPAFWGPGFDWTPDHNWGGSGMIGVQEMLMQCDGDKIYLFPAWPKEWDVHFKLHAPHNTTVEATLKNGKLENLKILPESRTKDVKIWKN